jgi:glycolate oxidase iron-sulfur subunit
MDERVFHDANRRGPHDADERVAPGVEQPDLHDAARDAADADGLAPQSVGQELVQLHDVVRSNFDAHHAPEQSVMDACVHCGFCLPACPTYVLWGEEMDSPRGRIWMMRKAATGEAELDQSFRLHMDQCLGCMACMTACPSGVEYNKLIEDTRGQVQRQIPRSMEDSLFRRMLFVTFPYPGRLRALAVPMALYQRSGLQRLVRASGVLRLLPRRLQAMEALLPTVPAGFLQSTTVVLARLTPVHLESSESPHSITNQQPTAKTRLRVGMLTGCVQDVFFGRVNRATMRVLAAVGCEVVVPEHQGCCGALMVHSGLERDAAAMAKATIAAFERTQVDVIVINAAGCGSTMKEYGHLLRDEPEWAARAAAFAARCKDVSEFLAEAFARDAAYDMKVSDQVRKAMEAQEVEGSPTGPMPAASPVYHPLPMRVAYHDACHLRHAQGIWEEPRAVLSRVPGLVVEEIAEASLCCGSAGVYNLLQPEPADALGDRKVEHLIEAGVDAVVSANPGCLLQLMAGLRRRGMNEMSAFHMIELIDASIRGITPDELRREAMHI